METAIITFMLGIILGTYITIKISARIYFKSLIDSAETGKSFYLQGVIFDIHYHGGVKPKK